MARAGALLTRVLYVKENHGKRFVIVDAGMNDLLRPALYKAHHRIEPVQAPRACDAQRSTWSGPSARPRTPSPATASWKSWSRASCWPIRDAGAYGFVMASTYNMRPRPAEVMIEDGKVRLIRRRETFEDLVGTEV